MGPKKKKRRNWGPALGAQSLGHWTTREVPKMKGVLVKDSGEGALRGKGFWQGCFKETGSRRRGILNPTRILFFFFKFYQFIATNPSPSTLVHTCSVM